MTRRSDSQSRRTVLKKIGTGVAGVSVLTGGIGSVQASESTDISEEDDDDDEDPPIEPDAVTSAIPSLSTHRAEPGDRVELTVDWDFSSGNPFGSDYHLRVYTQIDEGEMEILNETYDDEGEWDDSSVINQPDKLEFDSRSEYSANPWVFDFGGASHQMVSDFEVPDRGEDELEFAAGATSLNGIIQFYNYTTLKIE